MAGHGLRGEVDAAIETDGEEAPEDGGGFAANHDANVFGRGTAGFATGSPFGADGRGGGIVEGERGFFAVQCAVGLTNGGAAEVVLVGDAAGGVDGDAGIHGGRFNGRFRSVQALCGRKGHGIGRGFQFVPGHIQPA
ncbi:MAG: hypothetical protein B7X34_04185 [Acidobacteriia bacterium 12-62-4]|nr:MAG: hypothetical protein B7X34_04185 [Acidobacteriia bacterium 12-62-4]